MGSLYRECLPATANVYQRLFPGVIVQAGFRLTVPDVPVNNELTQHRVERSLAAGAHQPDQPDHWTGDQRSCASWGLRSGTCRRDAPRRQETADRRGANCRLGRNPLQIQREWFGTFRRVDDARGQGAALSGEPPQGAERPTTRQRKLQIRRHGVQSERSWHPDDRCESRPVGSDRKFPICNDPKFLTLGLSLKAYRAVLLALPTERDRCADVQMGDQDVVEALSGAGASRRRSCRGGSG